MAQPLQPNFELMNQGIEQFSNEISKLANIPQVGMQDILQAIARLSDRIETGFQRIENRLQAIEAIVEGLERD